MTTNPHNPSPSAPFPGSAEETLHIVAGLRAPAGLEDRVRAALHLANIESARRQTNGADGNVYGNDRRGRVLAWPSALKPRAIMQQTGWMRTAAAAAIVFVVAGGGWGVYTRVAPNRPARILVMPPRIGAPGGFSGAGTVRTPLTLQGPTVIATTASTKDAHSAEAKKPESKTPSKPDQPGSAGQIK